MITIPRTEKPPRGHMAIGVSPKDSNLITYATAEEYAELPTGNYCKGDLPNEHTITVPDNIPHPFEAKIDRPKEQSTGMTFGQLKIGDEFRYEACEMQGGGLSPVVMKSAEDRAVFADDEWLHMFPENIVFPVSSKPSWKDRMIRRIRK